MRSILTALILLPFCAFGQDLTKPIDYTTKAVPLRVVLTELSKQSGVKLKCTLDLEEEPLILRLDQVPVKDVMDKIADVFVADWTDHGDYKELSRSNDRMAALRSKRFDERVKAFKESLESLVKLEAQSPPLEASRADALVAEFKKLQEAINKGRTPETSRRQFVLSSELPGMRLGVKVLAQMDPVELASIEDNTRVVYATSASEIQRPLQMDPSSIQDFLRERQAMREAVQRLKTPLDASLYAIEQDSAELKSPPARMIAAVQRHGQNADVNFTLLDEKGNIVVQDYETLGIRWDERFAKRAERQKLGAVAQKEGYDLSPLVKELISRSRQSGSELRPLSQDATSILLSPLKFDPLALATSDAILRGAELANMNAIALTPDSMESWVTGSATLGKMTLERFGADLRYADASMTIKDGWIVVKPDDPEKCLADRTPRPLLEQYLHQAMSDGFVSIENAATLRTELDRNAPLDIPGLTVNWLLGQNAANPLYSISPDTLRFFGSMTQMQKDSAKAKNGVTIPLATLTDDQKQMISDMVFYSYGEVWDTQKSQETRYTTWNERTDMLAGGIPLDTVITVKDTVMDAAFPIMTMTNGQTYSYAQPLESIAYTIIQAQHPELYPNSEGYVLPTISGWNGGTQRQLQIEIKMSGRYQYGDMIGEDHRWSGTGMTLEMFLARLSTDVRTKLQKQVDEVYQNMVRFHQGESKAQATGTPPPQ